jgi:predicted transcriptional regulator
MSSSDQDRKRSEFLKQLRSERSETIEKTQILLREQKQFQKSIMKSIDEDPKTIPEIADEIGEPSQEVLWHIAAMKKYGIVAEAGMSGDYVLYQRTKEP